MTFKISNQDVHTKQAKQKSFQTKRQHCCDPQCSSIYINTTENLYFMTGKLHADNFDFLYNMNQETCPIFGFLPDGSNAHKNPRLIS